MSSSARRALRILEVIAAAPEPMGVTAIAEAVGTLPGTAYRSLDALERCDLVQRYRASTLYQMGPAAARLRHTLFAQFPIRRVAIPFLRRLAFATSETVYLIVQVGWYALRIAVVAGGGDVRSAIGTGLAGPLDSDLGGRAILAMLDGRTRTRFLNEAPDMPDEPRDAARLIAELDAIAGAGHAVEAVDLAAGRAIAFPIMVQGQPVGAVVIDGPVVMVGDGPALEDMAGWQAIIAELEAIIGSSGQVGDPLAHIEPAVLTAALRPAENVPDEDDD